MFTGRFAMYSANPNMAASRQTVLILFSKSFTPQHIALYFLRSKQLFNKLTKQINHVEIA